uniref:Signal recognition particle 54 kDa protein n=1 Tax=Rhizochromulina marina TaxID=1034831 RepID=A0A7S2WJL8_9STRA|mmetsp:Transcript_25550/g.74547  ORF Transcript_25550/g.74547 Transcript_25550/m.74547 type:complete len:504 (+) Transcript_25550:10-1521(+)
MVLQELGRKLEGALKKLHATTVVDEEVVTAMLNDIARALLEADVNVRVVGQLKQSIKMRVNLEEAPSGNNRRRMIQKAVMEELVAILQPDGEPYQMKRGKPNVIMFVGLQGSGKTTTIAKYANYYLRKGFKCCMVCADTFRAGAYDQLKQNATKLRCPFYGSYTEADPVQIAQDGVEQFKSEKYEVIIVDTSGRHKQESVLFEEMQEIRAAVEPDNIVFILDATQGQAVHDQASSFHEAVDIGSCVITKLDGHAKGGGALSAVAATGAPITFLGSGEHFDDLEPFRAESFVSRLLGMGDMRGLVETIKETVGDDKNPELMDKFAKGVFTLRDMYEQFQNVMKLGPLSKVMSMIPGIPQGLMGQAGDQESSNRLKRFMYMMDSMTDAELDGQVDLEKSPGRIERISRGSGTHPMEVQQLLRTHKQFEGVVKKMGKSSMLRGGDANMAKQISRNPNQCLQQIHKVMDPRMLQQMGGAQNVMKMMKQMSSMDGGDGNPFSALMGGN